MQQILWELRTNQSDGKSPGGVTNIQYPVTPGMDKDGSHGPDTAEPRLSHGNWELLQQENLWNQRLIYAPRCSVILSLKPEIKVAIMLQVIHLQSIHARINYRPIRITWPDFVHPCITLWNETNM